MTQSLIMKRNKFLEYIRLTLGPVEILVLCAALLGVDVDNLRAWINRKAE